MLKKDTILKKIASDKRTPELPYGAKPTSLQLAPSTNQKPATKMKSHTIKLTPLRMLLKMTEFFTPSASTMVIPTHMKKPRKSG